MAHYAEIDSSNIVLRVLVISGEEVNSGRWGDPSTWIKTSYNTRGGIYYTPNTSDVDPDQSKAFRKNFAGQGYLWLPNGPDGEGFVPPSPYPSWVMNPFSYLWEAPVAYPDDEFVYEWDESTTSWKNTGKRKPGYNINIDVTTL